jgi:hypothetical protein
MTKRKHYRVSIPCYLTVSVEGSSEQEAEEQAKRIAKMFIAHELDAPVAYAELHWDPEPELGIHSPTIEGCINISHNYEQDLTVENEEE